MRMKDKIGIVTAAGSGMGRAGAVRFAREGSKVGVVDLDGRSVDAVVKEITGAGGQAIGIAADTASLGYPEILVGVIPAMHFVHLPRQIGRHKAFELLFSGKPVPAQEACAMGLVNRVVPAAKVKEEARVMARDFAARSPLVMELARDAFMRANDFEYRRAIENTVETICNIIETDDAQEGLAAFNEKRPPRW
jgi:enoyl-CoA hydratase/carnithine racemase